MFVKEDHPTANAALLHRGEQFPSCGGVACLHGGVVIKIIITISFSKNVIFVV